MRSERALIPECKIAFSYKLPRGCFMLTSAGSRRIAVCVLRQILVRMGFDYWLRVSDEISWSLYKNPCFCSLMLEVYDFQPGSSHRFSA